MKKLTDNINREPYTLRDVRTVRGRALGNLPQKCGKALSAEPTKMGNNEQGNMIMERRNASGARVKGISGELKIGLPDQFDLQLGYTFQKSRYKEPERWSDELTPQRKMFRTPDHYGYFTANYNIKKNLKASLFGNYTGSMFIQHNKGYIAGDIEKMTPDFWDMGVRLSYHIKVSKCVVLKSTEV